MYLARLKLLLANKGSGRHIWSDHYLRKAPIQSAQPGEHLLLCASEVLWGDKVVGKWWRCWFRIMWRPITQIDYPTLTAPLGQGPYIPPRPRIFIPWASNISRLNIDLLERGRSGIAKMLFGNLTLVALSPSSQRAAIWVIFQILKAISWVHCSN